jgi:hypothetical protein
LLGNSQFNSKVVNKVGKWGIALLINGYVDGSGYSGRATKDGGERFDGGGNTILVSEGYPV